MKRIVLILSFIVIAFIGRMNAQSDTVMYKELINDPGKIPNYELIVSPFFMDVSMKNMMVIGFGLGGRATFANKIKIQALYSRPYTKNIFDWNYFDIDDAINHNTEHPNNPSIIVNNEFKQFYNFEVSGGFVISDKTAKKNQIINLASQQTGNIILNTVTSVKTNIRKRSTIRLGYSQFQSIVNLFPDFAGESDNLLTTSNDILHGSGIEYSGVNYDSLENIWTDTYSNFHGIGGWKTNMNVKAVFLGVETEYITNLLIETDKFGKRGTRGVTKLYADIFYGKTTIDDFLFFNSNLTAIESGDEIGTNIIAYSLQVGDGENQLKINDIGFRVGLDSYGITPTKFTSWEDSDEASRRFNFGYKAEIGIRPGIKGNFYGSLGIYLVFNK